MSVGLAAELSSIWFGAYGGSDIDEATASCFDSAGNYYVAGNFKTTLTIGSQTLNSGTHTVIFVAKFNSAGQFVWASQSLGSGANTCAASLKSIAADSDGNVYICGKFKYKLDCNVTMLISSANSDDIFVAKMNSSGAFVWAKRAGSTGSDDIGNSICMGTDGSLVVSGNFSGIADMFGTPVTSNIGTDMFITKLNTSNGTLLHLSTFGGTGQDLATSMCAAPNGSYAMCGTYTDAVTFGATTLNKGGKEAFVCYLNSSLIPQWARSSEGAGVQDGDTIAANSSSIFISGRYNNAFSFGSTIPALPNIGDALFTAKLDLSGNFAWVKSLGAASSNTKCLSSCTLGDNALLLSGSYTTTFATLSSTGSSDGFILKLNPGGDLLWAQTLGGSAADVANSICANTNNQMLCVGYFNAGSPNLIGNTPTNNGGKDIFAVLFTEISADTPAAPQNLCINKVGAVFRLSWDAVNLSQTGSPITVTGYNVYYNPTLGTEDYQLLGQCAGTYYDLSGAELNHDLRFYRVKAYR
jgi:hypothetical protein